MASPKKNKTENGPWGAMAEFESPAAVYHGAEKVRDAGYRKWDVYSPFAIHGMEEAMGIKPSKMAWIVGICAAFGGGGAYLLQWWTSAVAFPMILDGKPYSAWEQFTPITFELSVLFSAFGAVFGMFIINGLPRWHHPLWTKERFLSASDDGFFIAIESKDTKFDSEKTLRFLEKAGAISAELVEED